MDFIALYAEAGMIGVVGFMFVYLVITMSKKSEAQQESLKNLEVENKGQSETIANMESMGCVSSFDQLSYIEPYCLLCPLTIPIHLSLLLIWEMKILHYLRFLN